MKNIASALVKAQKAFARAIKSSKNPHFKNAYAPLDVCLEAVMDALNSNGVFLTQMMHESDGGVVVETTFVHESGETLSAGKLFVPAPKHDPQGFGSALTYARRYSLMSACGIAGEDDDGEAARKATQPTKPTPAWYSSEDFKKNLPAWIRLIEDGKKTSDELISMIETKGLLSKDQKAIIASVKMKEAA